MKKPPQDHTHAFELPPALSFSPIAIAHSPYKERFGTPRQASVTAESRDGEVLTGTIELLPHVHADALRSLDGFDYVWAIYVFHLNRDGARWPTLVKPPRDPKVQHGVLATRSPHRPNPIGLSALRITRVVGRVIEVSGWHAHSRSEALRALRRCVSRGEGWLGGSCGCARALI